MRIFADFAPAMCREGWAVLPANGKSPIRGGFSKWTRAPGVAAIEQWALRDAGASIVYVPGLCSTGKGKRGIVAVDCDDADAIGRADEIFGPTPGKVRTRRGAHRLYDGAGLGLDNVSSLRKHGLNIDIKHGQRGAGIVVAPPSPHEKDRAFQYTWDGCDETVLHDLPPFRMDALERILNSKLEQKANGFRDGSRGLWLNDQLVKHAWACDGFDEALDKARTLNEGLAKLGLDPLDDREVVRRAKGVWKDREAGKIGRRLGQRATCTSDADEVRYLCSLPGGTGAFALLQLLRAEHGARCKRGETFVIAPDAMVRNAVLGTWSARKYRKARDLLLNENFIREVRPARSNWAAEYILEPRVPTPGVAIVPSAGSTAGGGRQSRSIVEHFARAVSASRSKPWKSEGVSRATWYRRLKAQDVTPGASAPVAGRA